MSEMGSSATEAGEAIRPARPLRPESGHSVMITRSTATCQKPAFGCLHSRNDGIRKKLAAGLTSAQRPPPTASSSPAGIWIPTTAEMPGPPGSWQQMWPDAWGVRMEHILRNVLIALLEQPNATLHDVLRLFSDKQFRTQVAKSLRNETVCTFLLNNFHLVTAPMVQRQFRTRSGISRRPLTQSDINCAEKGPAHPPNYGPRTSAIGQFGKGSYRRG
jgi:hypothetical protein